MWALLKKEFNGFFNSLIAYVVVAVFLVITGLFVWVFPVEFNVLETGDARLDGLFVLAPFVFLFLVPAITMRFFADEKRTGTLEMLMTKPVTAWQIVLAKFFAGALLVLVSLLPTLIYLLTIHLYASPPGVDFGGIWGSYLGLLFIGMVFVSVGVFASSLTENQIVAFMLALFLCGFLYIGFEMIHSLDMFGSLDLFIRNLGLQAHYTSISRGVVDSRDLLYFGGVIALFLSFTHAVVFTAGKSRQVLVRLLSVFVLVVALNLIGSVRFARIDLTSEGRYTLTPATRNMLRDIDDVVYVKVYLEGSLPAEFRRLRNDAREMLDEFRAWSDYVQFEFVDPSREAGEDYERVQQHYRYLAGKGLEPAQVQMRTGDGTSQRVIFPGALVSHKGREVAVQLLEDQRGVSIPEALHNSSLALEYNLASAIRQVSLEEKDRIAFLEGHGELPAREVVSATESLERFYEVDRVKPGNRIENLQDYRTLISARPREAFSEQEKFVLDQFLMQGGSMLWLVDPVFADMDSLRQASETVGMAWDINMDDFFFRYGARLNPVLIKDLDAAPHPVITGYVGGNPQINLLPWYFYPLMRPEGDHEIVRRLNPVRGEFVSSIDTVGASGVNKQVLLKTSPYSRVMPVPVRISLDILQRPPDEAQYSGPPQPAAVLLEGRFESLFRNRLNPGVELPEGFEVREYSEPAKMIVAADGNLIRNQTDSEGQPLPLGYDRYAREHFGNADFIMNAVNYLTDDTGLIEARRKELRMRKLDEAAVKRNQLLIQLANTGLPVLVVLVFGVLRLIWRRRRFTR